MFKIYLFIGILSFNLFIQCTNNKINDFFKINNFGNNTLESINNNNETVIRLKIYRYDFQPSIIEVKKGTTVKIMAASMDVPHGFKLNEFHINEKVISGEITNIEFIADKKGTFTYYCSIYCGKEHKFMNGKLIVIN